MLVWVFIKRDLEIYEKNNKYFEIYN